jgi:hypothetical protein
MIVKCTNQRNRGHEVFDPMMHNRKLSDAIEGLLLYEFGFGGQIVDLQETKVVVRTRVMNCIDTTTIEWNKEQGAIILDIIAVYVAFLEGTKEGPVHDILVEKVMKATGGKALMVKLGAGIIMGELPVKATMLHLIGSKEHNDQLKKLSLKNLFPIFDLVYLEKQDINEVMGLVS